MEGSPTSDDRGILSIFRLYVGIRLVFSLISFGIAHWLAPRATTGVQAMAYGAVESALLLIYLYWAWLGRKVKNAYLLIALEIAAISPIIENYLAIELHPSADVAFARALAGQWQVSLLMLIPIILISWKYPWKLVLGNMIGLAMLDGALVLLVPGAFAIHPSPVLLVILFRTLLFTFIGFVINRLANEQRRQHARLAQANRQLAQSAQTLEQLTISRERNRMARELHDTLAHSLSAVAVQLEATSTLWESDPQQAHTMLGRSLSLTRQGLSDARSAIQTLRAAPLDDLGLDLALRNLANAEAERGGFHSEVKVSLGSLPLSPALEYTLYRIAEEALRNIARHARARQAEITLLRESRRLSMVIHDDGCGFDADRAAQIPDHFGLRGMRERAEAQGGQLTIISRTDAGTTVRFDLEATE